MTCRFSELRQKEVVSLCDGRRLGSICDIVIDTCSSRLEAIIVPGTCSPVPFFKGRNELIIAWCKICKFGDDVILVDVDSCSIRK